jgi:N-acylglucosamine 2-epimerase
VNFVANFVDPVSDEVRDKVRDKDGLRVGVAKTCEGSTMNTERLKALQRTYRDGLLHDVLPFWIRHAVDREQGGFFTCLHREGSVIDTDKSVWAQGRFSWLLGELYNTVEPRGEWLDLAKHGIDFLEAHAFDRDGDGRMYFHLARDGQPLRKRRYNFSESFAAIAYAEYARATGSDEFRSKAIDLFERFVAYNSTPGAMSPKYTDLRPMQGMAPRMITIVTAQELRDAVEYEAANAWIDRSIDEIRRFFVKPDERAVMEVVGPNGEIYDHFDGRMLNPGHAIEGAWFILNESRLRGGDAALTELGLNMLDWMWARGWDAECGGMHYFRDLKDLPVQEYWHDMKFWWPQNETIIATLMAYVMTGDDKYAQWHKKIHDWTYARFPDANFGEWYGYLHRNGSISVRLKGNLWKGPFHIPRMQLVCWRLVEELLEREE